MDNSIYNPTISPEEAASVAHLATPSTDVSPEEAQAVAPLGDVSTSEAVRHGVRQGLTLGFGDELGGGLLAGKDLLQGKTDLDHIVDAYKSHRDTIRAGDTAAQEQHPIAFGAGNVAGSLLPMLATGGAGGAVEGATALGNVGRAAATGAAIGGVSALGNSEKEGLGSVSDVVPGALGGAALGGALGAAGQGLKGVASKLGQSSFGKSLQDAFAAGKSGQGLINSADAAQVGAGVNSYAEDVSNALDQQKDTAGKIIGQGIKDATTQGATVDVSEDMAKLAEQASKGVSANTPDTQRVQSLLSGLADAGPLTPEKAQFYKKMLDNELQFNNGSPTINSEAEHLLNQARGIFSDEIRATLPPEVANAYDVYGGIANVQNASINGDVQQQMIGVMKDMNNLADPAKQQNVNSFFSTVGKEISPEFSDQLKTQMQSNAQRLATSKVASTDSLGGFWEKLGGSVLGAPVKGANLAGLAVNGVNTTANNVANAAPQRLLDLGKDLMSNPAVEKSGKFLGGILTKAATSDDPAKRRAMMFSVMQNPVYRDILGLNHKEEE